MPIINTKYCKSFNYIKKGNGKAIVLLHGFPADGSVWYKIIDDLAKQFTVIVPDLPGCGKSSYENSVSIAEMADCIKELIDHEGIKKILLAGHSMGGYVSLAFADKYPNFVSGISLVHSTTEADNDEKKQIRYRAIEVIKNGGKKAFIPQIFQNLFSNNFKQINNNIVESQIDAGLMIHENALINFYNAMIIRHDYSNWLMNIVFPIQWIIGIDDNVLNYKKLLQLCYKSDISFVTLYRNCGHMSMFEQPNSLFVDLKLFASYCFEYNNICI